MDMELYRVPLSVREGVDIDLPGAKGATFRVRLPSKYNREYQHAHQRAVKMRVGSDGKPDFTQTNVLEWQDARHEAFLDHCVVGMPEGMTREKLAGEYRPALEALYAKASEMAEAEDDEAIETVKKLKA
jgi:hypothetical protein